MRRAIPQHPLLGSELHQLRDSGRRASQLLRGVDRPQLLFLYSTDHVEFMGHTALDETLISSRQLAVRDVEWDLLRLTVWCHH